MGLREVALVAAATAAAEPPEDPPGFDPYHPGAIQQTWLERMRAGEFKEGECCLRAKIDMASPDRFMRDPVMYRILHASHHRTGDDWCIYPMYDFAHGQSDAIEGITHSLCTLEFEVNRPLYDWVVDNLPVPARPLPSLPARWTAATAPRPQPQAP